VSNGSPSKNVKKWLHWHDKPKALDNEVEILFSVKKIQIKNFFSYFERNFFFSIKS